MEKPTSSEAHGAPAPGGESTPVARVDHVTGRSDDLDLRFRILSAEYSHTTSMLTSTWSISASRTNLFFVAVSAAGVALALLGNASRAGGTFPLLALPVLLLVLVMGIVALTRMLHANREATIYVQSLNRIRHFFAEIDPESKRYMGMPTSDDAIALFGRHGRWSSLSVMSQMPAASMATLIALINAFTAGATAGIVYVLLGAGSQRDAVIAAGAALALGLIGFEGWVYADLVRMRRSLDVRFPTTARPDHVRSMT